MKKLLFFLLLSSSLFASQSDLSREVQRDLTRLGYPPQKWRPRDSKQYDVVIIGGGQSGLAIAFALRLKGVTNTLVVDTRDPFKEGPWLTTARMQTLRSPKDLQGPAMGIPSLTFRAWYESQHGEESWDQLGKIPTTAWAAYLRWFRETLDITVVNNRSLQLINPRPDGSLQLIFDQEGPIQTRKVVLATGREGFGGCQIPTFVDKIPKKFWAHTAEVFDTSSLIGKRVTVLGVGASGFDAAATALESGSSQVDLLMRRDVLPCTNHFANHVRLGFAHGYYHLNDWQRVELFSRALDAGIPPPQESIERVQGRSGFTLHAATTVERADVKEEQLILTTNQGPLETDFLILATGYTADGSKQPELAKIHNEISLWRDILCELPSKLALFPYLGPHFEFQEKNRGAAPYLLNIHCFNYGAFLSHGGTGDIATLQVMVHRLVEGLVIDLFKSQAESEMEPIFSCNG